MTTAHTPCAYAGCDRTPHDGWPLYRTNPKGERGVFMCAEHAGWSDPVAEAIGRRHAETTPLPGPKPGDTLAADATALGELPVGSVILIGDPTGVDFNPLVMQFENGFWHSAHMDPMTSEQVALLATDPEEGPMTPPILVATRHRFPRPEAAVKAEALRDAVTDLRSMASGWPTTSGYVRGALDVLNRLGERADALDGAE